MPSRYDANTKAKAVRLVRDHAGDYATDAPAAGDRGYVGVEGIGITPIKRAAGCDLRICDEEFNTDFNGIRAAIERAVATLKTWRMLSQEGGRYRAPIEKFEETLQAIIGLLFFRAFA